MTTSTTTQTTDTTVADLLAQTNNIGAELVQQAPTTETTSAVTGKVGVAVDAVKNAAGASLNFLQENKVATVATVGVIAVASYAAYKWYAKRKASKKA